MQSQNQTFKILIDLCNHVCSHDENLKIKYQMMIVSAKPYLSGSFSKPSPDADLGVTGDLLSNVDIRKKLQYMNSGCDALVQAILSFDKNAKFVVFLPALICSNVPDTLRQLGCKLVYYDCSESSLNAGEKILSQSLFDGKYSKLQKILILVNYFGFNHNLTIDFINKIKDRNIFIIEDSCHSGFSMPRKLAVDARIFSFRKLLPCSDGGALYLKKNKDIQNLKLTTKFICRDFSFIALRLIEELLCRSGIFNIYNKNFDFARNETNKNKHNERITMDKLFDNNKSVNYITPFLFRYVSTRSRIAKVISSRRINYDILSKAVSDLGLDLCCGALQTDVVPQVLPVIDHTCSLESFLRSRGIGATIWPGVGLPNFVTGNVHLFPNANRLGRSIVCLPVHQSLNDAMREYIISTIKCWKRGRA